MADTPTTRNRLRKLEEGAYQNTWATPVVEDFGSDRLDESLDGVTAFTLSGPKTLTSVNFETDEARRRVLNITGGTGGTVTVPAVEKNYLVRNGASGDVTLTNGSNSVVIKAGNVVATFTDATGFYQARVLDYGADLPRSTGTPTNATDLVTKAYADQLAFSGALPDQSPGYLKSNGSSASWAAITSGEVTTALGYTPTSVTGLTGAQSVAAFKTGLSLNLVENKSSATIRSEMLAAANAYTGKQSFSQSTASRAGINIGAAGTAPTVPVAGDLYPTAAGLNFYDGSVAIGLGPWRQIGSTAASGAAVTFANIPQGFGDLLIVFDQISPSTNGSIQIALSDNGSDYTPALGVAATASQFRTGSCKIDGYRCGSGVLTIGTALLDPRDLDVGDMAYGAWRCAPITHIRLTPSAGTFDFGTFTLYAR